MKFVKEVLWIFMALLINSVNSMGLAQCAAGCSAGCAGCNAMVALMPLPQVKAAFWAACAAV